MNLSRRPSGTRSPRVFSRRPSSDHATSKSATTLPLSRLAHPAALLLLITIAGLTFRPAAVSPAFLFRFSFRHAGTVPSQEFPFKSDDAYPRDHVNATEYARDPPPERNAIRESLVQAGLGVAAAPDSDRPPMTLCEHSCVQTLHNVCVNGAGEPVKVMDDAAEIAALNGSIGVQYTFVPDKRNPQHAMHENMFPLAFYLANCYQPETHMRVYINHTTHCHDDMSHIFVDMAHWFTRGRVVAPKCMQKHTDERYPLLVASDEPVRCFATMRYLLDPLQSPCYHNTTFRFDPAAATSRLFNGFDGLGLRVYVSPSAAEETPPQQQALSGRTIVARELRKRAMHLLHDFSAVAYGMSFPARQDINGTLQRLSSTPPSELKLAIINRFGDARNRKSRNDEELAEAIRREYPGLQVSIQQKMSQLSFAEQRMLFHQADIVIAIHGAALGNVAFMRPGSLLVTGCYERTCRVWEYSLARLADVVIERMVYDHLESQDLEFVDFDIPVVMKALDAHLNPSGAAAA